MTAVKKNNPWIVFRKACPEARLRLFCFPYAGGGASIYRTWVNELPARIDVCPVQLPGRENRLSTPAFRHIDPLVEALLEALAPELDGPYAFFGHSMGAIIAYELAQRLRRAQMPEPIHLLVSARRAPQLPPDDEAIYDLPEDELKTKLRELNGTPEAVLAHPELMELMLPLLRADFELNDTYEHTAHPPLGCPISAFGGTEDSDVEAEHLEAWRAMSTGPFERTFFDGDHFFIHDRPQRLIQGVAAALARHL